MSSGEQASTIAAVQTYTKPSSESGVVMIPEQSDFSTDEIDPGYFPFVSDGYVSLAGSEKKVSVKILRDPGSLDSFILSCVTFLS